MTAPASPYKFLDYFSENESDRFFGRERDVAEIIAGIARHRTFVLYGPSGTGKTSLVRAGVSRELTGRGFIPIYARVLRSPLDDVRAEVARVAGEDTLGDASLPTLLDRVTKAPDGSSRPVVVVLDQFEEFFTRFKGKLTEQRRFIEAITLALQDADLNVRFLFSLREDYLAELDAFREAAPDVLDHRYRLQALTAFGAREAIARPLLAAGIDYSPELLDRLVDRIAELGFDPSMLQIICSEVYKQALRRGLDPLCLEVQDLEAIGDIEGIFQRYLDQVTDRIPKEQHLLARSVFDALITPERTKRAMTMKGLLDADFVATEDEVAALLDVIVEQRLIRRESRGDEVWYELIHDRLMPIVLAWLDVDLDFFQFRAARELIANSSRSGFWRRNPETLLNEGQLDAVVGPYKQRLRLDDVACEFVLWSAVYRSSKDVGFWADRYGDARSAALTRKLMTSGDPAVRLGAARAAASLKDDDGKLANLSCGAALGDDSIDVRRAAGKSLAKLARDPEIERIRAAMTVPATRKAGLEVLADLIGEGRQVTGFSWLARRRARSIRDDRLLREHAAQIDECSTRGAIAGVVAAVGWTILIAPVLAYLATCTSEPGEKGATLVLIILTGSPGMIAFCAAMGWSVARSAACWALLSGEEHWFRATLRPRDITGVLGFMVFALVELAFLAFGIYLQNSHGEETLGAVGRMVISFVLLGIVIVLIAVLAHLNQLRRLAGESMWRRGFWALVTATGVPLLLPALAVLPFGPRMEFGLDFDMLADTGFLIAGSWSAVAGTITFSLGARSGLTSRPAPALDFPWKSYAARAILLSAWACTVLLVAYGVDRDMVPAFAPNVTLLPDTQASLTLKGEWPRLRRFHVINPEINPIVARFDGGAACEFWHQAFNEHKLWAEGLTLVSPGKHQIDVHFLSQRTALSREIHIAVPPSPPVVTLGPTWSFSRVKVSQQSDGRFSGVLDVAPGTMDSEVAVAFAAMVPVRKDRPPGAAGVDFWPVYQVTAEDGAGRAIDPLQKRASPREGDGDREAVDRGEIPRRASDADRVLRLKGSFGNDHGPITGMKILGVLPADLFSTRDNGHRRLTLELHIGHIGVTPENDLESQGSPDDTELAGGEIKADQLVAVIGLLTGSNLQKWKPIRPMHPVP